MLFWTKVDENHTACAFMRDISYGGWLMAIGYL